MDLGSEDKDFLICLERVINYALIRDIEDLFADLETGVDDPYLNMDFGISRGEEEDLQRARVKLQAVDVEGRPIGQATKTRC